MDIAALEREAGELLKRHGLSDWSFEMSGRLKSMLGLCDYNKRSIRVNRFYAENNPERVVLNTLLHEVAHALTPWHGHDSTWMAMAVRLGCTPERVSDEDILLPDGKFQAVCTNCRRTYHKHRLHYQPPIHPYYCMACGKERGVLAFAERSESFTDPTNARGPSHVRQQ